jgi:recombination protein RecR
MAYPSTIQKLIELFSQLPGIGPRQARRFAFALLDKDSSFTRELAQALQVLQTQVTHCRNCFRVTETRESGLCEICSLPARDQKQILVVEKDPDVENFEKSGGYTGTYHVLGGIISPLDKNPGERLRLRALFDRIKNLATEGVELIIATSNTFEGNQTANYIERIVEPLKITITRLGRGLSTGSEIEYADPQTLENALKNRR